MGRNAKSAHGAVRVRLSFFSPRNASALYVLAFLIIVFSVWTPDTFPKYATIAGVLNDNVVAGIVGLSLVLPLAAREFDISVGYNVGASSILFAWLLGSGAPVWISIIVTLLFGMIVGVVNAIVVVVIGIESFIATLATGALLYAFTLALSGGVILVKNLTKTSFLVRNTIPGVSHPVMYMIVIAVALWVLLQHTAFGRRLLATGFNAEAAKLAGVPIARLKFLALVSSGVIASSGGLVVVAQVGAATPSTGPDYLIPAFAAAFLGSTQLWPGIVNGPGTLLALITLGTLRNGLSLAGVPTWVPELLTGVVLIVAVGIGRVRDLQATRSVRRQLRHSESPQLPSARDVVAASD